MVNGQVETRRLSNENFRLANVDSLTDLPNRRQFFHRLSDLAEQAKMANRRFVVGVLDLDGFKAVNDRPRTRGRRSGVAGNRSTPPRAFR